MENNFEFNKQYGCFQIARSLFHDELWLLKPAWHGITKSKETTIL